MNLPPVASRESRGAGSCFSTTSCSDRTRKRAATAARGSSIRSATSPICTPATRPSGSRLSRPDDEDRGVPKADGLDDPVVFLVRGRLQCRLRRRAEDASAGRLPGRRVVWPQRLHARRRGHLSHVLHNGARRRGSRQRVDLPRPDPARPPGDLGGLSPRATRRRSRTSGGAATTNTTASSSRTRRGAAPRAVSCRSRRDPWACGRAGCNRP